MELNKPEQRPMGALSGAEQAMAAEIERLIAREENRIDAYRHANLQVRAGVRAEAVRVIAVLYELKARLQGMTGHAAPQP